MSEKSPMAQYEEWVANHSKDNPPSEKIIKLGRKITDVAGHILGGVKVEDPYNGKTSSLYFRRA